MSNMKYNINRLHGLLISSFEDVSLVEKSNNNYGNYQGYTFWQCNTDDNQNCNFYKITFWHSVFWIN